MAHKAQNGRCPFHLLIGVTFTLFLSTECLMFVEGRLTGEVESRGVHQKKFEEDHRILSEVRIALFSSSMYYNARYA